jgi:hypothetical protein
LNIIKKLAKSVAKTKFASKAINDGADLSAFKEKPSVRILFGILLMGISYIIGWPAIVLFAGLSLYWHQPLIIVIGGPLLFGLAHLVFLAGMYLAGRKYIMVFLRWATRVTLEKLM